VEIPTLYDIFEMFLVLIPARNSSICEFNCDLCDNEATKCGADRPILLPDSDAMHLAALLILKDSEAQNSPVVRVSSVVMLVGRKGVNAFGNTSKMMD
jgi:hypothetical protein